MNLCGCLGAIVYGLYTNRCLVLRLMRERERIRDYKLTRASRSLCRCAI